MNGHDDLRRAANRLASALPEALRPLARVAYNYRWAWAPGGETTFRALDAARWDRNRGNPVAFLSELDPDTLAAAAADPGTVAGIEALAALVDADLSREPAAGTDSEHPVAFFCAEFGVHASLPVYSGGLGVLAGDIVKEASDLGLPMVGLGLFYRRGYFHQRVDRSGWQHESWVEADVDRLPAVRVTAPDGEPLTVPVPIGDRTVVTRVWRVDVGRTPLLLLDTDHPTNSPVDRWITARLYDGNRAIRLAQYTVLGIGGVRALRALGVEPSLVHLNEGHAGLAALELARGGGPATDALATVRDRIVFTTHTPVAAGNETYAPDEVLRILHGVLDDLGVDHEELLDLGRVHPGVADEPVGMTALALRAARVANGVSARHGDVAREMWSGLAGAAPIVHVTNGVHLPTWTAPPFRALLDDHLGPGWAGRADDPDTWAAVDDIPAADLWRARNEARATLVEWARARSVTDRLNRGEALEYVEAAAESLEPDVLTVGFARRLASYKRLSLLARDPERAVSVLQSGSLQFLFGGKAHPEDDAGKALLRTLFELKGPTLGRRVAFLEDYDLTVAPALVAGCDVWVNLPRPPYEASGTSGMKVALSGGLNLSVLDGWWCEGYDGTNGWAIDGRVADDPDAQDDAHARAFYDLLEQEVIPAFTERDAHGIPPRWVAMMRASLRTLGPRFCARRMLRGYREHVYEADAPAPEVRYRLDP